MKTKKEVAKINDSVLLKNIVIKCILSLLILYMAIDFFRSYNPINNKKIDTKNLAMRILSTKVVPILLVFGVAWFAGGPILDYCKKDYEQTSGTLRNINSAYRDIGEVEFKLEGDETTY